MKNLPALFVRPDSHGEFSVPRGENSFIMAGN